MSVRLAPFVVIILGSALAGCHDSGNAASRTTSSSAGASSATYAASGPDPNQSSEQPSAGGASEVTITSPRDRAAVQHCAVVAGRARLAPGKTIVLSMMNLDNGDDAHYYAPVDNWSTPKRLAKWTGNQYFGSGNSAVGQKFELEALIVDVSVVEPVVRSKQDWSGTSLPRGAVIGDRVELKRVAGNGPIACN